MMRVKATREGLIGGKMASGVVIGPHIPFVALPSSHALFKFGIIRNPATGRQAYFLVLDVGPWNVDDDEYVFAGHRPQAESGVDRFGRATNGAGIDLSEAIWKALGMTDNSEVEWEFLDA